MTSDKQPVRTQSFLTFLQKRKEWQEVTGYHVGDIHSAATPVLITEGCTVVGNVIAPEVIVFGLLCGAVITKRATLKKQGQIWGDLFAVEFVIEEGGKIQGWISTVEPETATEWINEGHFPEEKTTDQLPAIPKELLRNLLADKNENDVTAYHILQSEIATALAARAEIEHRFEERIDEVAGGAAEKIETLTQQLTDSEAKKQVAQDNANILNNRLDEKSAQLEHHQSELALTRKKIADLQQRNDLLESKYGKLSERHSVTEHDKRVLENNLTEARQNIEQLNRRLKSAEEALKGSLQHSSELQESLERWQELAEANEKEAETFKNRVNQIQFQLAENEKMLELVREQKKQVEDEWLQVKSEHERVLENSGAATDESATERFIEEASQRMSLLEHTLLDLLQQQEEEVSWYKLNLQNQARQLENAEQKLTEERGQIEALVTETEQLYKLTSEQQSEIERLTAVINHTSSEHQTQLNALKAELEKANNQVEATEADLQYHIDAISRQGQHLAEVQSRLSEREVQLRQASQVIKQQKAVFQSYKEKATQRIQELQSKLKTTNRTS